MKKSMILCGLLACAMTAMPVRAQWSGNTENPVRISESYIWGDEMLADDEGNLYFYYLTPESRADQTESQPVSLQGFEHYKSGVYGGSEKSLRIVPYVKKVNYDGTMAWEAPIRLSAYPTLTYTMVNSYITLDKQGNLVAVVWDARLDSSTNRYTATAYKISPEGKMLWGEDGVNLCSGKRYAFGACMNLTTLDDNSTVFAWAGVEDFESDVQTIYMQRVTADGKAQWTDKKMESGNTAVSYPYMVNAGSNEYFMFYCSGSTPDMYVQKYDFDGNAVWAQPTLVYGMGGFGNGSAMQVILTLAPAKNGLLVGWNDDRNGTQSESVYIAYIDRDGKHVFAPGDAGLQVGYSGNRGFQPSIVYNYESDDIYVVWRETSPSQTYQQVRGQRISLSGELLWSPEGVEICAFEERQAGQGTVQAGLKGGAMFFYMKQRAAGDYGHTEAYATLYSQEGKPVWDMEEVPLTDGKHAQASLYSTPLRKNQWVVSYHDNRNYNGNLNSYDVFAQNVLIDGKLGSDAHLLANEHGVKAAVAFGVSPNPVRETLNVRIETAQPSALRLTLCNSVGMEVATLYEGRVEGSEMLCLSRPAGLKAGLYVVKAVLNGSESSVKVVLQ